MDLKKEKVGKKSKKKVKKKENDNIFQEYKDLLQIYTERMSGKYFILI